MSGCLEQRSHGRKKRDGLTDVSQPRIPAEFEDDAMRCDAMQYNAIRPRLVLDLFSDQLMLYVVEVAVAAVASWTDTRSSGVQLLNGGSGCGGWRG